ncbi:MAG TPA: hypothetical protein VGR62_03520 [Candidatus Binatia bacterium]|jgi:hypothetical protein|nr:hypothetical protein [Candidatus Binatia bacterium]
MPRALALVAALALLAGSALAHPTEKPASRELVRIQGHRSDAKAGTGVTSMVIAALGVDHPFAASDVRTFGFGESTADVPTVGPHIVLQGGREVLTRFTGARPDQQVTILAERRSGASDLFVLTIDLCPPR